MTAYRRETELLTAERIPQAALLFLLMIGGSGGFEYYYSPDRMPVFGAIYSVQTLLCLGLLLLRTPLRRRAQLLPGAIVLWSILGASLNLYGAAAETQAELAGLANVMFVAAISMMMPWGTRGQAIVSSVALLSYATSLPFREAQAVPAPYLVFAVTATCLLSIVGARSLDLHRLAIFRESTERDEEAAINRTLLTIGTTMNSSLDAVDVLDRIAGVVRQALDLKWSLILLWDEQRQAFRIAGGSASDAAGIEDVRTMEIPVGATPLIQQVLDEGYVEIVGAQDRAALDPAMAGYLRRYRSEGILATTLIRGGQVIGILAVGMGREQPRLSDSLRQLFQGSAQHAAIALDNVRLVADLRQADRLKSEFVSTMSHELRTPMNVILGYSDLFLDGAFGPLSGEQHHTLQRLRDSARSLLELINATLEVNRLEADRSPVEVVHVALADLMDEIARECEDLPRAASVALVWNRSGTARVRTDPRKLKIILKNLIGNALKFTLEGHVSIRSCFNRTIEALELRIADTGPGIAAAELPEIFGMFRQAEGGHVRGGVGLGLYIVKRFVDQLGGQIQVTSRLGNGSVFTVTLPATACDEEEEPVRVAATGF